MTHSAIIFQRKNEPRENAFSMSVPQGWLMEGGIMRADLTRQVVNAQSIAAKIDLSVMSDPVGTVMLRFCPSIQYADPRWIIAAAWGMFPIGSNYNGAWVYPLMPAPQFLVQMMFPWAHPQAQQAQLIEQQPAPGLVADFKRTLPAGLPFNLNYEGGMATYTYVEGGVCFKEKAFTIIEDTGQLGAGMWSNKNTWYYRAPSDEFARWEPVLIHMHESVRPNPEWVAQEIVSQEFLAQAFYNAQQAAQARAQRALEVQRYIQDVNRQIVEHRQRTYAEMRNDAYLMLTNQEEYVNPYTQQVDLGSNQWNYRWVNANGDEFYSDYEGDNPNYVDGLRQVEWQRSPTRPRFPNDQ